MSDEPNNETNAVSGDGVITVDLDTESENKMAVDLPENVAGLLQQESVGNMQTNNRDGRNVSTTALGVLQMAAARNFDELGVAESRAASGLAGTPMAGPTNPAT